VKILAVTHGPDVGPELFGDVVREEGQELVEWDICNAGPPPRDVDAVMVFGGDQNVGEEDRHPWLRDEYDALRHWVETRTPLLAVCLGAQTLAHSLGGVVEPVGRTLAGFYASTLTPAGSSDPVLGVLPPRFAALNANGYRFSLPADAVELAQGPVPQAYRVNGSAWAVQFHPEVRREQFVKWLRDDPSLDRPVEDVEAELDEQFGTWQEQGRDLCRAFLRAAGA
jgi:GMP synthase (glutamine-hydrolysing)